MPSVVVPPTRGFNPRSPRGGATKTAIPSAPGTAGFNPRSPRGGATSVYACTRPHSTRFNPRSPRGGATKAMFGQGCTVYVSIHAPHEGERRIVTNLPLSRIGVSIHAPHEGERLTLEIYSHLSAQFQSTLPTRGSDVRAVYKYTTPLAVSIHAPHEGERRRKSAFVCSISANLLNIIHCGTVTRAVSRRRIALFRLFSVRRSGVFMYAYASH